MTEARFSSAFARGILHVLDSRSWPVRNRLVFDSPDSMLSGEALDQLWLSAVAATRDDHFGLHLGESFSPAGLGLLGFAMISAPSLGVALDKLVRYWGLLSNATIPHLHLDARHATLEIELIDIPGNFLLHNRHPVESSLSGALTLMRTLSGTPVQPLRVECRHAAPLSLTEPLRVFGVRPIYRASRTALVFPASALQLPLLHANAPLLERFEQQMQEQLKLHAPTATTRVRSALVRSLRGEGPSLAQIAALLGQSERSLQRQLQQENTTWREILDDLRRDLSAAWLKEGRHSIADISFLLGFAEPSVFHRSVRRWFGLTPAQFRAQQQPPQSHTPT